MNDRNESLRQLNELALSSGRKRQSPQTGFVHHWYSQQSDEPHLTIPIVENFLFILALFKSRTADNITEAKSMLEALLPFQNRDSDNVSTGNFPIYLHEYPACKERYTSVHAAVPLFWILKLFHQVLGRDLKQRLEEAFVMMLKHVCRSACEHNAPYHISVKAACLAHAGGSLLGLNDMADAGLKHLENLSEGDKQTSWYCPASIGTMLSGLAMVYPSLSESPWNGFWKFLESTWHRRTCSYIGPSFKERQHGYEPQITLYDLFLGFFSGGFSSRALEDTISHLEGSLIRACDDNFQMAKYPLTFEGICGEERWHVYHGEKIAYSTIQNNSAIDRRGDKGFHVLRMVWGDSSKVHTLVCQGNNGMAVSFIPLQDGLDITFVLAGLVEAEDREKNREIIFFVDAHEGLDVKISGHKSTTFSFGELVTLQSGECSFSLQFQSDQGRGRFMGHRMLGNRPSQLKLKGKDRYHAYDWQIFLRTMERSDPCVIKVSLRGLTL